MATLLTVEDESVPPDCWVGHEPLYPRPVNGCCPLTDEVLELPARGEALAQVGVGQAEPGHGGGQGAVHAGAGGGQAGGREGGQACCCTSVKDAVDAVRVDDVGGGGGRGEGGGGGGRGGGGQGSISGAGLSSRAGEV